MERTGKKDKIMVFFSIIMPAYNVGEYIGDCLDSILRQSFSDYEVIIVDDESSDNTYEIAQKYSAANSNIKVKRIEHVNVGVVRNEAIHLASGKYLIFVDADDFLEPEMFQSIFNCLKEGETDICYLPNHYILSKQGKVAHELIKDLTDESYYFEDKNDFFSFVARKKGVVPGAMWTQVCRRQKIVDEEITFKEEYIWSQDGDFGFQVLKASTRIAICSYYGYIWNRLNAGAATQKVTAKKIISRLSVYKKWYEEFNAGTFGSMSADNIEYQKRYFLRNYYDVLKSYAFLKNKNERLEVEKVLLNHDLLSAVPELLPRDFMNHGLKIGRINYLFHFYLNTVLSKLKN